NKLLYCDVSSIRFEEIEVARVESCPVCGRQPKPASSKPVLIEESCGRNNKRVFTVVPKEKLNIEMEKLVSLLRTEGALLKVKAKLGVTFVTKTGILASVLKSGVMIVEGTKCEDETLDFYKEIIVDKMKIPWTYIS
ncbi:MAG: hypothetical protein ACE5KD_01260, partial [Candidatus Bathyarchaeia archaeon]